MNIQQVGSRMPILHREFSKVAQGVVFIEEMKPAPITIIAVNDQSIKKVSEQIPYEDTLVVHTSGSISMESLSAKNRKGVFYPLQTFSKSIKVDFTQIPICLETEHENDRNLLREIAFALSENVYQINSIERKQLHLAAVFANNFVNHCYTIAEELCAQQQLPFELLKPLIETTAQKAISNSPLYAQEAEQAEQEMRAKRRRKRKKPTTIASLLYAPIDLAIGCVRLIGDAILSPFRVFGRLIGFGGSQPTKKRRQRQRSAEADAAQEAVNQVSEAEATG